MFGALIGDIVGSRFEWNNWKSKDFDFFSEDCFVTDDSIMTLAICKAFLQKPRNTRELALRCIQCMQELGKCYPRAGYGVRFARWLIDEDPKPYESFGNGAAMRVSATAYVAKNEEEVKPQPTPSISPAQAKAKTKSGTSSVPTTTPLT